MTPGERIKAVRVKCNLTQRQLANRVFVHHRCISRWETGVAAPRRDKVLLLAKALECSADYLLGIDGFTERERLLIDTLHTVDEWLEKLMTVRATDSLTANLRDTVQDRLVHDASGDICPLVFNTLQTVYGDNYGNTDARHC